MNRKLLSESCRGGITSVSANDHNEVVTRKRRNDSFWLIIWLIIKELR